MCKFYSAIVMKNGDVLHNENLTSHEDIIALFNLRDTNTDNFVRVEFTPADPADLINIEKYLLNVDESVVPEWFEQHREFVFQKLKDFVERRIISDNRKLLTGGIYILNNCKINKLLNCVIERMVNSQIGKMYDNSQIGEMYDNSQIGEMYDNSQIGEMRDNSQIGEMRDNSQIGEMYDNSQIREMRNNSQIGEMYDNSRIINKFN